jgi:hypothetical protein
MRTGDFLIGVAAGILGVYIWRRMSAKAGKNPADLTVSEVAVVAKDVIQEEGGKFGEALKKEYDIVMPADQVKKKVRQRARELTRGRYAIDPAKVKEPVSL